MGLGVTLMGCSKDEPTPGSTVTDGGMGAGTGGDGGVGGEEITAPPQLPDPNAPMEGVEKLDDPNAAPVLAERDGKYYEVYEIATDPYDGKVMKFQADGTTPASEKVYVLGVLQSHTEWHANGAKKLESLLQADGYMKAVHFDEQGKEIKPPMRTVTAPGRGLEWKTGGVAGSIEILYKGKTADIIQKAFGPADEELNGVWVYKGMKVRSPTGQILTTVRFTIQDGIVFSVGVEP